MTRHLALACASVLALSACQNASENSGAASSTKSDDLTSASQDRDILPASAKPVSYEITITPNLETKTFTGEATLVFDVVNETDQIIVNGLDLEVVEARIDGVPVEADVQADTQRIAFVSAAPIAAGQHTITTSYSGIIYEQSAGLFHVEYPAKDGEQLMLASQFEPGDARRLAPMWDEPGLKATFKMSVIAPEEMSVISNTPVARTTAEENGQKRIDFEPTPKMSSYLLFLGMGDLSRISQVEDGVEHGVVTKAGDQEKGRFALDSSVALLPYFNDYFGVPYPLEKLDHIAVPGAGGFGAMENWGAIMYFESALVLDPKLSTPRDKQRVFGVVAHEMAHQWFGDLVTMAWWNDLWLNEGFASWMASKSTDNFHPAWNPWLRAAGGRNRAMSIDSFSSTHPIVQNVRNIEEANLAFDAITYLKGQAVIRMIEAYVGEDAFREGVRAYMHDHAYGNTTTADLWRALEAASDAPIRDIARDFTTQPGVPLINVSSVVCDDARDVSVVTLSQGRFAADEASKAEELVWQVPVTATTVGNTKTARTTISGAQLQEMKVEGCGAVKINAAETSYFRTNYEAGAFDALDSSWTSLDAADQLGLLNDAYALGQTGDAPYGRFLTLSQNVTTDAEPLILSNVAANLSAIDQLYTGRPSREAFAAFARERLGPVLDHLGWEKASGESDNLASLRASLIGTLARLGDEATLNEAHRRFALYEENPDAVGADILRTIVSVVASNADEAMFEKLFKRAQNASSPLEQRLYLFALTGVRDETLAAKALELFLTADDVPTQLRARLISGVGNQHPELVWSFYIERRADVDALLDPLSRHGYPAGLVGSSLNVETADQLEAFAKDNLPASAGAAIARTVNRMRYRAQIRDLRLPELDDWLAEHAG